VAKGFAGEPRRGPTRFDQLQEPSQLVDVRAVLALVVLEIPIDYGLDSLANRRVDGDDDERREDDRGI
jgi:hypothetical protein